MREGIVYIIVAVIVLMFFIYQSVKSKRDAAKRLKVKVRENFGNVPKREYEFSEYEKISHYHKANVKEADIDDITWNDLDMDKIFMLINNTYSSAGEEYLYHILRSIEKDTAKLENREKYIRYFSENENIACEYQEIMAGLGRTKSISLYDFIFRLKDLGKRSSLKHYIINVLLLLSIGSMFIQPGIGIVLIIGTLGYSIFKYFSEKAEIESYFICFQFLVKMLVAAEKIFNKNNENLSDINMKLKENYNELSSLQKGIFMLSTNNMSGSLGEIVMEYVRMITHVDIIKFNSMVTKTIKNTKSVDNIFCLLGELEASLAIASFRKLIPSWCNPEFSYEETSKISFEEIYHPLISKPVSNSLQEANCVLITGSNASGKSTFLKTVAINSILAQTINTCTAKKYKASYFNIYSSMALRDDLESNESYYIVEIKSLKRILDKIGKNKHILCFVDEVLRGTNTVERIAASTHILKLFAQNNVMCFAATHDIELTHILTRFYSNYHFTEEILENDVKFSYELNKGRATSRNAIKLLSIIGFDKEIVNDAEKMAEDFLDKGIWEKQK